MDLATGSSAEAPLDAWVVDWMVGVGRGMADEMDDS